MKKNISKKSKLGFSFFNHGYTEDDRVSVSFTMVAIVIFVLRGSFYFKFLNFECFHCNCRIVPLNVDVGDPNLQFLFFLLFISCGGLVALIFMGVVIHNFYYTSH